MLSISFRSMLLAVSMAGIGLPAGAAEDFPAMDARFTNLAFRETPTGVVLTGTVRLPRATTPPVAAHVDVLIEIEGEAAVIRSGPVSSRHPRQPGYRKRSFSVELPTGTPANAIHLSFHAGAHP